MKLGIMLVILGILGIIIGGALYAADYHRTIGLGGIGLGVLLLIVGGAMTMMKGKAAAPTKTT